MHTDRCLLGVALALAVLRKTRLAHETAHRAAFARGGWSRNRIVSSPSSKPLSTTEQR